MFFYVAGLAIIIDHQSSTIYNDLKCHVSAIHRAAGPELLAACEQVPEVKPGVRCPTGEARITPSVFLPDIDLIARYYTTSCYAI